MNFITAIALLISIVSTCLFKHETSASQLKLPTRYLQPLAYRYQINSQPFKHLGAPVEASQISRPDKQEPSYSPTASPASMAIKPINASRIPKMPTTTARPSHDQIPRPAVMASEDIDLVTSSSTT